MIVTNQPALASPVPNTIKDAPAGGVVRAQW